MHAKRKNKASNFWKWLIAGVVLSIVIVLATIASFFWFVADSWDIDADLVGDDARSAIETLLDAPLPDAASDIHIYYVAWQDFYANIRFSAAPNHIDNWLAEHGFCFSQLDENAVNTFANNTNLVWWQPSGIESYAVSEQCGDNPFYQLLIDKSDSENWIVYLSVFST